MDSFKIPYLTEKKFARLFSSVIRGWCLGLQGSTEEEGNTKKYRISTRYRSALRRCHSVSAVAREVEIWSSFLDEILFKIFKDQLPHGATLARLRRKDEDSVPSQNTPIKGDTYYFEDFKIYFNDLEGERERSKREALIRSCIMTVCALSYVEKCITQPFPASLNKESWRGKVKSGGKGEKGWGGYKEDKLVSPTEGSRKGLSFSRFQKLLSSRTEDEFLRRLIRVIKYEKGNVNSVDISYGIYQWVHEECVAGVVTPDPFSSISIRWSSRFYQ